MPRTPAHSPDPLPPVLRDLWWAGAAMYGLILIYAVKIAALRMLIMDMAFQTFLILKDGSLQIQSGRFGAAVTQVFAWAAQAAGLSLKGVLTAYSIGHALWPALLFFFALYLRQWQWALCIAAAGAYMTTHTFYWLSEMHQGLPFLLAIFAWMHARGNWRLFPAYAWPLWIAALITAFYFHPLLLYACVFVCLFFGVEWHKGRDWTLTHALALGLMGLIAVFKYKILPLDWYDAMSLERAKAYADTWPRWFDIQANRDFVRWCLRDYYLFPLLLVVNTFFYIQKKHTLKALLVSLFPCAYVLLVNVPFHTGDKQFYLENMYLPLSVMVAVPFIFDVTPSLLKPRAAVWLLVGVWVLRLGHVYEARHSWQIRQDWQRGLLAQTAGLPERKLLLSENQAPMDTLLLSWSAVYELLLLSALEHPDSARSILIDERPERFDSLRCIPSLFLGEFRNYPWQALPQRYFAPCDSGCYIFFKKN